MRTSALVIAGCAALAAAAGFWLRGVGDSRAVEGPPRVIFFVGDGMGIASVTAARIHKGTLAGLPHPSDGRLHMDTALRGAFVRTHSTNRLVTDSAAGITAFLTGERVANGVLCRRMGPDGTVDTLLTVLEMAEARGLATGIVTTTRLTHATPAGAYAHAEDRDFEDEIAAAIVPRNGNPLLGDGIEVLLGGGLAHFLPEVPGTPGQREDRRNLLDECRDEGYTVVATRDELQAAVRSGAGRLLGVFSPSHMAYVLDREETAPLEPNLPEMVSAALDILSRDPDGYFLLVEGGRIDHALHANNGRRAVAETLEFDEAIGVTLERTDDEALILVTADHDHSMVLAGYAAAAGGVFSQAGKDRDGIPYTTILHANGPGGAAPSTLDGATLANKDFRERAGVPLRSDTHGGQDVPLFAWGPAEILARIPATLDNTEIFPLLRDAIVRGE